MQELSGIRVHTAKELLTEKSHSGLGTHTRQILGVIYPESSKQVKRVMSAACEQEIPIYPVSCGKNWGYGLSCPPVLGCIVMDLYKMNRVLDFDPVLGRVEIELGVTQGQLSEFLGQTEWMMDCTGAGPDTSLVGNILERGFVHSK